MELDLEGAKFGAINALRTGSPLYDMMIAMIIPLIFKMIFDGAGQMKPMLQKAGRLCRKPPPNEYLRVIEVEQKVTSWGWAMPPNGDDRNHVLIKAVNLYLADKQVSYKYAKVNLTSVSAGRNSRDDSDDEGDSRSDAGELKKNFRLTRMPPESVWVDVENGVRYWKETEIDKEGGGGGSGSESYQVQTLRLKLVAPTEKVIDEFVTKVYAWYLSELRKMEDNSRYLYEMSVSKGGSAEGEGNSSQKYRRYKLSDDKTFKSIFFPEKDNLLDLIEHFKNRTGKYAIPGYPHKLGLLLHGPPGTGKTSMIKALAHHTKRSIVNVPLARLDTNAELMEVMFDQKYQVIGQQDPVKLRLKDVIFVMEDVDAISKIVHRRDGLSGDTTTVVEVGKSPNGEVTTRLTKTTSTPVQGTAQAQAAEKNSSGSWFAAAPASSGTEAQPAAAAAAATADEEALLKAVCAATAVGPLKAQDTPLWTETKDKLNLSGILNVLDGVVDAPNRLLVMTTNHPEKLDPALIRPGRVDKKFHLSYLVGEQAVRMAAHYFQEELEGEAAAQVCQLVDGAAGQPGLELTPARLEQFCAEHETVEGLSKALAALAGKLRALPPAGGLGRTQSISVEAALAPQAEVPSMVKKW
mmetsp:Transcript_44024/g.130360  ORF Transcript_44024/g.130360 Transcript_44024/m.130360 type:complete len:634 (-) Transcript_44024:101-2002(-)